MSVLAQRLHIFCNHICLQKPIAGSVLGIVVSLSVFIRFEVRLALASPINWNASVETTFPSNDSAFLLISRL